MPLTALYCSLFLPKRKAFSLISLPFAVKRNGKSKNLRFWVGFGGNAPTQPLFAKRYLTPEQPVLSFKKLIVFPVLFENNFFRHAYGVPTSGVFHRLLPPQAVTISNVPQRGRLCV